ncbi:MAG: PD-(D/E)XK nuclease family protein, partial [Candidatus Omnitrophica bacterium]|nr:PD-(D/E)XK nuclease family protein [Candidatus Omnitrophota bacterium]
DYLRVLLHPFCKNFKMHYSAEVTRIMAHKIQDVLTGREEGYLSGSLFLELNEVLASDDIFALVKDMAENEHPEIHVETLVENLSGLHHVLFHSWEGVTSFAQFAATMTVFLDAFIQQSTLKNYPLNLNIANKIYQVLDEFSGAGFCAEQFPQDDLFKVFDQKISSEIVAFIGSPLKGLQLLGLFETRSLNFDHVIIMDVNEGVLPNLVIHEPLIPRDVMITLGLNRVELDEEIQRYQFMRLISAAKDVHLIYQQNKEKERSRFVEELLWEDQKKSGELRGQEARIPTFHIAAQAKIREVPKTPEIVAMLKSHCYSASSINTYLKNPLEFYYRYVLGLREQEDLLDEPEARQIGSFVHEFLEKVFRPYVHAKPVIDKAFIKDFESQFDQLFDERFSRSMKSDSFLLRSIVRERLRRFIQHEQESHDRQIEKILGLEQRFEDSIPLAGEDIRFIYIVDRIDLMRDGTVMILDYKTGGQNLLPKKAVNWGALDPNRETILEHVRSFQIPLYFHYLRNKFPEERINAALYNLRTLDISALITDRTKEPFEEIDRAFMRLLDVVMAEILDINVNFVEDLRYGAQR